MFVVRPEKARMLPQPFNRGELMIVSVLVVFYLPGHDADLLALGQGRQDRSHPCM